MGKVKTEDEVRDMAKIILGFDEVEDKVQQGTGQLTKFNTLGFKGVKKAPDGWYLPENLNEVAIVLETKGEIENIEGVKEKIFEDIDIISIKYKKIVGIIWNGKDIKVFKNKEEVETAETLQHKQYYIDLFKENNIDKNKIYSLTEEINNLLHFRFGMKNYYHRMIFTACALVVERFGGNLEKIKDNGFNVFRNKIFDTLSKSLESHRQQNLKIDILLEVYSEIKMNIPENQNYINSFIDNVIEISNSINSDNWNGEDVMGIFFNEFNRYKKKSENGQIFTPEHITSFMYDLLEINHNDKVLDATCGSGGFLVKAMAKMLKEVGGVNTNEAEDIKQNKLYGIEFDREIFALACANMLIHKDGKSNLEQLDTREDKAWDWINSKEITKVLMNPPYERGYGCKKIVENVLDSVSGIKEYIENKKKGKNYLIKYIKNIKCAFILPDKKIEKEMKSLLKHHTLEMIIKLPEKLFDVGVTTSIFVFEAGKPQNNKEIFACYIEDDGLERVKNQGRHDIKNKWNDIAKYWLNVIKKKKDEKYNTHQWLNPKEYLSYQMPKPEFELYEEDFVKTIFNYTMFENNIDIKELKEKYIEDNLYKLNGEDDEAN